MKRADKIRAVRRYLVSSTGIPSIYWDGVSSTLDAPLPYAFTVSTDGSAWRFFESVKQDIPGRLPFTIRYDAHINNVDSSVVGMRLYDFAPLLKAHYEAGDNHNREGD